MPSAPPNSELVSEIAEAAPARAGGAAPMARSAATVNTGASPTENTTDPVTRTASPEAASTWVSSPTPTAASVSPPAITNAGRMWRTSSGVSMDPRMTPPPEGTVHRPARSGDSPSTSCRYCTMNSKAPKVTKKPRVLVARAALKARLANRPATTAP